MRSEIKKMIFSMRVSGALESDYKIMAMEGIEPIESANDELIFRYQQHEHDVDDKERIDYSKRDFLTPVSNGDVIIEYIKPQIGRNGRNCKGELIAVLEPKVTNDKQINYADSIERVEDEKSVKYISKKSGYVTDKGGSYGIEEDMALNEIDFKTTGSIEAGLDSNIKINLSESDAMKDAIGAGMSVESTEVIVQGNIGPQVNIRARLTKIGGQTHATSMIHSDSATISVHRGSLEAIEANIDRIEGGKVVADIVKIKSMIGGEVIARQIYIEELNSNASLISSELIEIQELKGSNNKILFDTGATKDFSDTVKMLRDGLKSGDKEIEKSMKLLENKKDVIDKNKNSVEAIRKRIDEMKITGEKVPSTFLIKLKDYQQLVNEYNQVLKQIKEVKEIMRLQRIELNEIQSKIYNAKVVNHSPWKEYNEIKFKLIEPPVVLEYSTKEMENAQSICLKHDDDNKLYISRNE